MRMEWAMLSGRGLAHVASPVLPLRVFHAPYQEVIKPVLVVGCLML
jgi:hypothetical protein